MDILGRIQCKNMIESDTALWAIPFKELSSAWWEQESAPAMLYQLSKLGPSNKDPQVYELRMVLQMPSIATSNPVYYPTLAPSTELIVIS